MYIVIENFWTPTICTELGTDEILYFETEEEAKKYADEECQNGTVVNLN